jgi:hypothetical protein
VRIKSKETKKKEEEEEKKEEFSDCINGIDDSAIAKINSRCILNPANDFILCSVSFLSPCAAVMPNKSAYIHKDFFFFSSLFFFFISADYFFSLALSFRYSSSTKANNRKNERERNRETTSLPTHHITPRTYTKILFCALFLFVMLAWREHNT